MPASGARITILPIRLVNGSGAAARIVGLYDDDDDDDNSVDACLSGADNSKLSSLYLVPIILCTINRL